MCQAGYVGFSVVVTVRLKILNPFPLAMSLDSCIYTSNHGQLQSGRAPL